MRFIPKSVKKYENNNYSLIGVTINAESNKIITN